MEVHLLVAVPLLSAFVGWITNVAAVRLLFWPVRPLRIPGVPWALHGVIPRRQEAIARNVAEVVERVLVRPEDVAHLLALDRYREEAVHALVRYVDERLEHSFARLLPGRIRQLVRARIQAVLQREAPELVQAILERWQLRWPQELRLAPAVARRVAAMDPGEFEAMLLRVIGRELRWLEMLGALLGFVVGLVQLALLGPALKPA